MTFPAEFFTPYATEISGISQSNPAIITTSEVNNYASDLSVRIVFPYGSDFGMNALAGKVYQVTPINPTNFSIPVDSTNFEPFTIPAPIPGLATQVPQVIPVCESGTTFNEAVINDRTMKPEYSWTNTTFPWINNPNYVSP